MKISTKELRTHTQELFDCLARGQTVTLTYRGKAKGIISAIKNDSKTNPADYPVFGMWSDRQVVDDVDSYVREIRKARF